MESFVCTKEEIKELEQATLKREKIDAFSLMRRAGKRLFEYILNEKLVEDNSRILVFAGPGNNGGDAFVLADMLAASGYAVNVIRVGNRKKASPENKQAFKLLKKSLKVKTLEATDDLKELQTLLKASDVIIDGLFGIGIDRPLDSPFKEVVEHINLAFKRVLSIDIPSGVNADNGLKAGEAVHASHTLIVGAYKPGNLLGDALDTHGTSHLIPIGFKHDSLNSKRLVSLDAYDDSLDSRTHNTHKYHYGQVMVIGGSPDMPGAPHLSGLAALRTGSGLVRLAFDMATKQAVSPINYELTYHTYKNINELLEKTDKTKSIVYGIGMGETVDHEPFLKALIEKKIPIVIDGDGLKVLKNIIWDFPNSLEHVIIMPHVGEMARLLDCASKDISSDPLGAITSLTSKTNMTVALKGPATLIANRDNVTFLQAKNPGLATAGSGDTLAGITASLLGRDMLPLDAMRLGAILHSKAGLYARKDKGEESLIASDIITYLPHALKDIKK